MNISKSQSYNLSPDEYLQKFQKPHSVISYKGKDQKKYQNETKILQQILQGYNQNSQTLQIKQRAIKELTQIVQKWINIILDEWKMEREISNQVQKNDQYLNCINQESLIELGYGLKIFGSYSLKTNSFDGDIDMVCIVPDFFSRQRHFYNMLTQQLKKHHSIKMVFPISEAIVPLIKLSIYDVQIDLSISRIPISFLQKNPRLLQGQIDNQQDFHDYNINQKQLRGINGYLTSFYLKQNIKTFKNYQVVLKVLKMWAKNKGIYSQIYGYLGGAALSIMLTKIFQLYPNYSPFQLLDRFFFIYANWVWTLPVTIQDCYLSQQINGGMVIFTPLKPQMNAAHYVSRITCHITRKYLRMASKTIQDINKKKKDWKDLFKPVDFFNTYNNFIQLSVMGQKTEDFIIWKGNIESKLRKFIKYLQNQIQNLQLIEIHPYPSHFISKHQSYKYCYKYYFGIKCQTNPNLNDYCQIDITPSVRLFLELLQSYHSIDKVPKQLNIGFRHVERCQIEEEVIEGVKVY